MSCSCHTDYGAQAFKAFIATGACLLCTAWCANNAFEVVWASFNLTAYAWWFLATVAAALVTGLMGLGACWFVKMADTPPSLRYA